MQRFVRSPTFLIAALAIVLSLLFLGQRGIWDPDEGRYTNVALHMLDSGDCRGGALSCTRRLILPSS